MGSFIVEFWSKVFFALGRISLFNLVRWILPFQVSARFVDAWVLGHLGLSFLTLLVVAYFPNHWISVALVIYGVVRVFEVAVYQANVLLFDEYRAVKSGQEYALEGYRRIVLLLVHNYFEIIIWLAGTYIVLADQFAHKWEGGTRTVLGGVYSSFITMTTFGDFDLLPKTNLAAVVLLFHTTVGLFMTLLSLARFISLIPAPKSKDPVELKQLQSQQPNQSLNRTRHKRRAG